MGKLFIIFAIMPIIEIAVLMQVGEQIGGWNTVAIVVLTAFAGAYLVRQQGLATLAQAQQKMQTGVVPGQEMAEGLLLLVAGVLLVTPGFVTDGIGFLFALPITRPVIASYLSKHMATRVTVSSAGFGSPYGQHQSQQNADSDIIEGEYEEKSSSAKLGNREPRE